MGPDPAATTADAIVVAAGASTRMGGVDKLAAPIDGRPLLGWTLDALAEAPVVARLVVVTSSDRVEAIRDGSVAGSQGGLGGRRRRIAARDRSPPAWPSSIGWTAGGPSDDGARVVLVHDGARPVVSVELIEGVATAAAVHGAAIPVVPIGETVKRIAGGRVEATVDRSALATAQTPQGVRRSVLRAAFERYPADGAGCVHGRGRAARGL